MKHATLVTAYQLSLYVLLPLGILLMVGWGAQIYRRLVRRGEAHIAKTGHTNTRHLGCLAFFFMLPGLALFFLFSIPVLYFNHLLQQEDYCLEIIRVNKITTRNNAFLQERAAGLDIDELLERSKAVRENR